MDDFYRAGITTIKFACKEGLGSAERTALLQKALGHFKKGEEDAQQLAALEHAPGLGIAMSPDKSAPHGGKQVSSKYKLALPKEEVTRYCDTITFELALLEHFATEADAAETADLRTKLLGLISLSLFRGEKEKQQICIEVILRASDLDRAFQLAQGIMTCYALANVDIFRGAGTKIVIDLNEKKSDRAALEACEHKIDGFLTLVSGTVDDASRDAVLQSMADQFNKLNLPKQADKMVQQMRSTKSKINAFIACNKLKAAYLVAVREKMYDEVVTIHALAKETSNRGVINICEKYFKANPRK